MLSLPLDDAADVFLFLLSKGEVSIVRSSGSGLYSLPIVDMIVRLASKLTLSTAMVMAVVLE
jgi:hypothetical protein